MDSSGHHGLPRTPMEFHEFQWTPMQVNGFQWTAVSCVDLEDSITITSAITIDNTITIAIVVINRLLRVQRASVAQAKLTWPMTLGSIWKA